MDHLYELYGNNINKFKEEEKSLVYTLYDGQCVITKYEITSGIDVVFNDIHVYKIFTEFDEHTNKTYEINFCKEGRFECVLKDGTVTYMTPGDFAVNPFDNAAFESIFPIGYYTGISIYISPDDLDAKAKYLENIMGFTFESLIKNLCVNETLFIKHGSDKIQNIFNSIYDIPEEIIIPYLKVKIQELFLYLSTIDTDVNCKDRIYFTKSNVDIAKNIYSYVLDNFDRNITYQELSNQFNIKLTTMKSCYKSIYGENINDTLRKTRLKEAAKLIIETDLKIIDVALQVGYSNHNAFSSAFKKLYNISPSEFRKTKLLKF